MKKTVEESITTLTELMIPSYANFGGKVHGGIILSLMDKVAYVCASKHTEGYCVTAAVGGVSFMAPVEVGDLVTLYASVNYVGRTSLMVGIKVVTENFRTKTVRHTNTSYFTFVSIDDDGKPREVPSLILRSEKEITRFVECRLRKVYRKLNREEFAEIKKGINVKAELQTLKQENCEVELE